METPLQLEIEGFEPSTHLRQVIENNVTKLEHHYGRMTACRVVIRAPDAHHRLGEPYFVTVRIALPGHRDVSVKPPPRSRDRRQAGVNFAVNDAFRRADRQLRDHASKLKETQDRHVSKPHGKVLRIDTDRNFGYLESEDGREIYFHENSVLDGKFRQLVPGSRVSFHEEEGDKGPQASNVCVV